MTHQLTDLNEDDWVHIIRPGNGSEWCKFVDVIGDRVNVMSWDSSGVGSARLPFDYRGQWLPMNYPLTCVLETRRQA